MEPRYLLQWLMDRDGLNSSSLAREIKKAGVSEKPTTQPQIHKFLGGKAVEPKRATLQPVADYFKVTIDAFYDGETADRVMEQLKSGRVADTTESSSQQRTVETLGETLASLADHLRRMDMDTRSRAVALIEGLANNPDSHATVTAMIELSIQLKDRKCA